VPLDPPEAQPLPVAEAQPLAPIVPEIDPAAPYAPAPSSAKGESAEYQELAEPDAVAEALPVVVQPLLVATPGENVDVME
jgi:hypothetical protein